jgi:hypothetical protein
VFTREKTEVTQFIPVMSVRLVQVERLYVREQNAENIVQNIRLFDSQILMMMEKRGHNVYFARTFCPQTARGL